MFGCYSEQRPEIPRNFISIRRADLRRGTPLFGAGNRRDSERGRIGREVPMTNPVRDDERLEVIDAPMLLAILIAARRTGDRRLERITRRELEERHSIKVQIGRGPEVSSCQP
jgi:hypothetical protein